MKIQIPGKIFLSGEYAALQGYPALLVAVNPGFEFEVGNSNEAFHSESPAGLLEKRIGKTVTGVFHDPYKGVGGLARSTAEYLAASTVLDENQSDWNQWQDYRNLLKKEFNTPSGADLLTQKQGGYCVVDTASQSLQKLTWPFADLDWVAVITGHKVKTHEHLSQPLPLDWHKVQTLNEFIVMSFKNQDSKKFVSGLNAWRNFLLQNQLEVSTTTELVEHFLDVPGVIASKGCGALGSDVVLVVFEKDRSQALEKVLERWNPLYVIRSSQVSYEGLKVIHDHEVFGSL